MKNARSDALAHRFVAFTLDETKDWPVELQHSFHQLAFSSLPELVLELDEPSACRFARGWRVRIETELASPATPFTDEDVTWLRGLAEGWTAPPAEPAASGPEISRLAELLRRFGPLALAIPWRDVVPAKS